MADLPAERGAEVDTRPVEVKIRVNEAAGLGEGSDRPTDE